MITLALIPLFAILGRLAGGGWPMPLLQAKASILGRLPEFIAACIIVYASGLTWWILPAVYFAIEAGHGNAFHDGVAKHDFKPRHQSLDYIVLPLCKVFAKLFPSLDFENRGKHYCRLFMFTKGFLIGLPLGFPAIITGVGYAAAYAIGWRYIHPRIEATVIGEYVSYASIGLAIAVGM
jgi:hypothetical protein